MHFSIMRFVDLRVDFPTEFWVAWSLRLGCGVMAISAWWCQFVRYPAFRRWDEDEFQEKHQVHTLQISVFVIPGMLLQLAGTIGLWFIKPLELSQALCHSLLCALSIGPTLTISGPIHGRLARGKQESEIERLITTNQFRSWVWTIQAFVAWLL
jgi:hypothetical protein